MKRALIPLFGSALLVILGPSSVALADPPRGPCDIYADDGGPCVAAHSTVRRLLSTYTGPLYQVRKEGPSGGRTKDIGSTTSGFADAAAQDVFCSTYACTISIIYDQSGKGNHLTKAPPGGVKTVGDNEANAKALPITISGRNLYGEHNPIGVGYANHQAVGTAMNDEPETIYMITSGTYYNDACCFEYGNAMRNGRDNGDGTTEAIYFGKYSINCVGGGDGPWVLADFEYGMYAGDSCTYAANTPVTHKYITAMVKGDKKSNSYPDGHWAIKVGNAQSGSLTKPFEGKRPRPSYNPMRKEGAIILGIDGQNSNSGQGNFFEGVMTAHYSSDAADDAVQANIVSVYGK